MSDKIPRFITSQFAGGAQEYRVNHRHALREALKALRNARLGCVRGVVSSVRCLRRGGVSVTLRFTAIERELVLRLEPGKVVAVEGA